MKILFVHDNVFLTKNGKVYSNTFPYTVLKRYVDTFSNVTVLARAKEVEDTGALPLASGDGVTFVFLENISTLRSFFGLRRQHEKCIKNLLLEHDAVIVRVPSELGLLTAKAARETSVKCLLEVVGCAWDALWNYGGIKAKIYAPFLFLKMKNSVGKAEYVTYVTESFLQKRYPSSERASTMGISDVMLPDVHEETLLKRVKKIEDLKEHIIFGTIASLSVKYKGIEIALKALAETAGQYDHFEYHILGEGDPSEYKTVVDKLGISDKVFFDGTLPVGEAVAEWLESIDIYLQPSLQEGLPRALVEAMSRGCPAIGSSVGGIPELLDKKMLVSPGHCRQLSEKIGSLIDDRQLMLEAATHNFNKAKAYQKSLLDEKRSKFWIDFRDNLL